MLESLLAGETLDKKVETKEEEPMSECQVRLSFLSLLRSVVPRVLFVPQAVGVSPSGRLYVLAVLRRVRSGFSEGPVLRAIS